MKLNFRPLLTRVAWAFFFGFAPMSQAQVITWGSPQNISGDSDVNTDGSLAAAYRFGSAFGLSATTVNGVTFAPFPIPTTHENDLTVGTFRLQESIGELSGDNLGTPSGLSSDYQSLLSRYVGATVPKTITLTMSGLTDGHTYLVEWWSNVSVVGQNFSTTAIGGVGDPGVTLFRNPDNMSGHLGQYVTGTFTLSGATSLAIEFSAGVGNSPAINAVQLREIAAIPEPSTWAAILGASGLGLAVIRRRRVA